MPQQPVVVAFQNVARVADLPPLECFERWVRAAVTADAGGEIAVRIVDCAESRALNRTYRGNDRATNVLAFPAGPFEIALPAGEVRPLGDLVICAPVVRAEARERGLVEEAHWAHLVVHGCLHLLGFDHQACAEAAAMEARETQLLKGLGFADPYEPAL